MFSHMDGDRMKDPFTFWFLAHEAQDLPGQWVTHCLDLDLVSQGVSVRDALENICDAVSMVLEEGHLERYRRAPEQDWALFRQTQEEGDRVELEELVSAPERLQGNVLVGSITVPGPKPASKQKAWTMPRSCADQLQP